MIIGNGIEHVESIYNERLRNAKIAPDIYFLYQHATSEIKVYAILSNTASRK